MSRLSVLGTWAGAALFALSGGIFLYSYAFTFVEQPTAPLGRRLLINVALFTAFALHHSLFARTRIRAWVARTVPAHLERSAYVAVASLLLIVLCRWWQALPGTLWALSGVPAWPLFGMQLAGVALLIRAVRLIDGRELAGLPPPTRERPADGAVDRPFTTDGPYGWVRHPIYAGWCLVVLAMPDMTLTRFAFASISVLYILIAIPLEERTLARVSAGRYAAYAAQVTWRLVPGLY